MPKLKLFNKKTSNNNNINETPIYTTKDQYPNTEEAPLEVKQWFKTFFKEHPESIDKKDRPYLMDSPVARSQLRL